MDNDQVGWPIIAVLSEDELNLKVCSFITNKWISVLEHRIILSVKSPFAKCYTISIKKYKSFKKHRKSVKIVLVDSPV